MAAYHFALRNPVGDYEDLGYLAMPNDDAALAFGHDVVRDILREHAPAYAGSVMEITQGERTIRSVPLYFETNQRQKRFG